jgi:hypothetical protein
MEPEAQQGDVRTTSMPVSAHTIEINGLTSPSPREATASDPRALHHGDEVATTLPPPSQWPCGLAHQLAQTTERGGGGGWELLGFGDDAMERLIHSCCVPSLLNFRSKLQQHNGTHDSYTNNTCTLIWLPEEKRGCICVDNTDQSVHITFLATTRVLTNRAYM